LPAYFEPVSFDGVTPTLTGLGPDPRLSFGRTGTIEALVAVTAPDPATQRVQPFCIVSCSGGTNTPFRIRINPQRTALSMSNGAGEDSVPFDFTDGEFHQVAVATYDKVSEVIIDGRTRGFLNVGYGPQSDEVQLFVGQSEGGVDVFLGLIYTVRLWSRPLRATELQLLTTYGLPDPSHPEIGNLVLFSQFSSSGNSLVFTNAFPNETVFAGTPLAGQPFAGTIPSGHQLVEVQVSSSAGGITGLDVIVKPPQGNELRLAEVVAATRNAEQQLIDGIQRRAAIWKAGDAVAKSLPAVSALLDSFAGRSDAFAQLVGVWKTYLQFSDLTTELARDAGPRQAVVESALARYSGTDPQNPQPGGKPLLSADTVSITLGAPEMVAVRTALTNLNAVLTQAASGALNVTSPVIVADPPPTPAGVAFRLGGDELIAGISGTYDAAIRTLRIITNKRLSDVFGTRSTSGPDKVYAIQLPPDGRFAGFAGSGGQTLNSLALQYVLDPASSPVGWAPDHNISPVCIDLGRYIDIAARGPIRDDDGVRLLSKGTGESAARAQLLIGDDDTLQIHGNYARYCPARVQDPTQPQQEEVCHVYRLRIVAPANDILLYRDDDTGLPIHLKAVANDFYQADDGRMLVFDDDGSIRWDGRKYRQPDFFQIHPADNADILPWGATFSSDQRPTLAEFAVKGYNIAKLDPRNYQLGSGTSQRVFDWPDDLSKDYTITTTGKIIPNGLIYKNDAQALEQTHTVVTKTAREHLSAWSVNLGMSIGVPEVMSFGLNGEYSQELGTISTSEALHTISQIQQTEYALVVDMARIRLWPEFVSAVRTLRDRALAGADLDFTDLVDVFGTHYPYAVTFGGMAFQEISYTIESLTQLASQGLSIEAHASGTIEAVTLGLTGGLSTQETTKTTQELKKQDSKVESIGGQLSFGGGWTLAHRAEVPLLLDLRPISELLSPLFFEDPIVWMTLKPGLQSELDRRAAQIAQRLQNLDHGGIAPRFFEFQLTGIRNDSVINLPGSFKFAETQFGQFLLNIGATTADQLLAITGTELPITVSQIVALSTGDVELYGEIQVLLNSGVGEGPSFQVITSGPNGTTGSVWKRAKGDAVLIPKGATVPFDAAEQLFYLGLPIAADATPDTILGQVTFQVLDRNYTDLHPSLVNFPGAAAPLKQGTTFKLSDVLGQTPLEVNINVPGLFGASSTFAGSKWNIVLTFTGRELKF